MADAEAAIHAIHPYPCKFPAAVARRYMPSEGFVVDPFCGSGTTLLEAAVAGRATAGIDCNPIAVLISKCKLINLTSRSAQSLKRLRDTAVRAAPTAASLETDLPEFAGRDHWFTEEARRELGFLVAQIEELGARSASSIVARTALSAVVNRYSRQDTETRYARVDRDVPAGSVLNGFARKLESIEDAIRGRGVLPSNPRLVFDADIRSRSPIEDESVDAIITSPPYANTMDYYLYHKQRMNVLGMSFKAAQTREIGSRHEFSSQKESPDKWSADLTKSIKEMARMIRHRAFAVIVIGDSQVAGELIDARDVVAESAQSAGLSMSVLESEPMTGRSRSFNAAYQRPNKFEHVIRLHKR